MTCIHPLSERQSIASEDGLCPICLRSQRDALLEELKDLHDAFQFTDESPGQGEAILRARKVIEEAEK